MIKHIALFRLKNGIDGMSKAQIQAQIERNVANMRQVIPTIAHIEVSNNHPDANAVFHADDLCVLVEFASLEDYHSYFNHPVHHEAAGFAAEVSETVHGITYEV